VSGMGILSSATPGRACMPKRCTVEGCERVHYGHGYCHAHWKRWRRTGDVRPDAPISRPAPSRCQLRGCRRKHYARGLCAPHSLRWYRYGDPRAEAPIGRPRGTGPLKRWPALALLPEVGSHSQLAVLLGRQRLAVDKWERVRLTTAQADAVAVRLGLHPGLIWDDWWAA
jgi:hypothetical protein